MVDHPFAHLEDAGSLPLPALPRGDLRPRGNGKSDRPEEPDAYAESEFAADALAVLDATETESASRVGSLEGAAAHAAARGGTPGAGRRRRLHRPGLPLRAGGARERERASFDERRDTDEGWEKYNSHYWLEHYADFLEFFFSQVFIEPHSTKQIEDAVGWGLETTPETLVDTPLAPRLPDEAACGSLWTGSAARRSCSTETTTPSAHTTRERRLPSCRRGTLRHARGLGPRAARARSR